jgi:opacity protein-like surface antigen
MYRFTGVRDRLALLFITGLAVHSAAAKNLLNHEQHYIKAIHCCDHKVAAEPLVEDKPVPLTNEPEVPSYTYLASVNYGAVWVGKGDQQTIQIQPVDIKTFVPNKPTSTVGEIEFFLGLHHSFYPRSQEQLGIEIATTGDAKLSGQIWDDQNPLFDSHVYTYTLNHTHVALKGKWQYQVAKMISASPYLSASLGVGFNRANGFNNTPTIPEAEVINNFTSRTTTSFTYTLGIGIQQAISPHIQVGVGYEFSDWGQNDLGMALSQIGRSGLSFDHLYTNGLMFNLTYVA